MKNFYLLFLSILIALASCKPTVNSENTGGSIIPLKYNNPGLVVDLGVGLWAWPLPMDFDNDGDLDMIVSCPGTPYNGLYFFENTSGNVRFPVFERAVKIGPGIKNLQVAYIQGKPRILGEGVEYDNFQDSILRDVQVLFPKDKVEDQIKKIRFSQWKYVDYENDGDLDLIVGIDDWSDYGWDNAYDQSGNWKNGPLHGYVYLLENINGNYDIKGKIMADGRPIDVYGAPSPNMMDFDGDGDLDIICAEFVDRFTWFENIGTREEPQYTQGRFLSNEDGIIKMDLEMIVPTAIDWDKDGDVDLVVGNEDGRVTFLENTGLVKDHMPIFNAPVYFQQKADWLKFGALATPFAVDWDDDGDQDLICGNTAGYIGFIENLDGGNPPKWNKPVYLTADGAAIRLEAGKNGSIQGPAEQKWGYTTLSVADWDGDGLKDIVVNSIWGKIEWFKNIGSKGSPVLSRSQPIVAEFEGDPPKPAWNWWDPEDNHVVTQWRTTPNAIDWNKDGLTDLVMLDTDGYLSFYERYEDGGTYKLKPGKRIFYGVNHAVFDNRNNPIDSIGGELRLSAREAGGSGRRKICITDWDGDGDFDFMVNGNNADFFENTGVSDGKVMIKYRGPLSDLKLAGHSTSPTAVNWAHQALPDLLIGAEDGHFYYFSRQ